MIVEPGRPCADDHTAVQLLDRYVEAGGNWIDTADVYSFGEAEKLVGRWLHGKQRDRYIVTSKAGMKMDKTHMNAMGLSRKHLVASLERTLENLNTPYDTQTPMENVVRTFNDFVRCGKVRHFGASNFRGHQLQKLVDYCRFMGVEQASVLQSEYNLLSRELELEVTRVCKEEGVPLTPWGALKGGLLSGKIRRGMAGPPDGSRVAWSSAAGGDLTAPAWQSFSGQEHVWNVLDILDAIAQKRGKTSSQVALRWLLQQEIVPSVLIGARTMENLESSIGAAKGWNLTQEEMKELNDHAFTTYLLQMKELNEVSQPFEPDVYSISSLADKHRLASSNTE